MSIEAIKSKAPVSSISLSKTKTLPAKSAIAVKISLCLLINDSMVNNKQ